MTPDPETVAAVADWIEMRAGRIKGLRVSERCLIAEHLRNGSWVNDSERPRARERAAEMRPHVAFLAGRDMTAGEAAEYVAARAASRRRAEEREAAEARAMERFRQAFEGARG